MLDWPTAAVILGGMATVMSALVALWPKKRANGEVYAKLVDFVRLETQFIGFRGEVRTMKDELKEKLDDINRKLGS